MFESTQVPRRNTVQPTSPDLENTEPGCPDTALDPENAVSYSSVPLGTLHGVTLTSPPLLRNLLGLWTDHPASPLAQKRSFFLELFVSFWLPARLTAALLYLEPVLCVARYGTSVPDIA
eukprot:2902924-Rhodomonas_salina.1